MTARSRRIPTAAPALVGRGLAGALCLASGAALVVYILAGWSLLATLGAALAAAIAGGAALVRRLAEPQRAELYRRARAGCLGGLGGTAAYDLVRWGLTSVGAPDYRPFETFVLFGQAMLGAGADPRLVLATGTAYHVLTGAGFGAAFGVWLGTRGPLAGIAWALVVEGVVVSVYPGWLGLRALDEFLQVSVASHVAFGAVLGLVSRRLLAPEPDPHAPAG